MTHEEKIAMLEEMFEAEPGSLSPDTALSTLPWDSMVKLTFLALINERFGKKMSGADIKMFKSIQDVLAVME